MKDIYQMAAEFRTAMLKAKANREFLGDGLIEFSQEEIVEQYVICQDDIFLNRLG